MANSGAALSADSGLDGAKDQLDLENKREKLEDLVAETDLVIRDKRLDLNQAKHNGETNRINALEHSINYLRSLRKQLASGLDSASDSPKESAG